MSANHTAVVSAFIARTKQARDRSGFTQAEIAKILGIKQDRYKQYETRSPLPHEFVAAFCAATRVSEVWLFNGPLSPKRSARTDEVAA